MAILQNILSIVMLKNVKLSYGNDRFQPQKYVRREIYVVTYVLQVQKNVTVKVWSVFGTIYCELK